MARNAVPCNARPVPEALWRAVGEFPTEELRGNDREGITPLAIAVHEDGNIAVTSENKAMIYNSVGEHRYIFQGNFGGGIRLTSVAAYKYGFMVPGIEDNPVDGTVLKHGCTHFHKPDTSRGGEQLKKHQIILHANLESAPASIAMVLDPEGKTKYEPRVVAVGRPMNKVFVGARALLHEDYEMTMLDIVDEDPEEDREEPDKNGAQDADEGQAVGGGNLPQSIAASLEGDMLYNCRGTIYLTQGRAEEGVQWDRVDPPPVEVAASDEWKPGYVCAGGRGEGFYIVNCGNPRAVFRYHNKIFTRITPDLDNPAGIALSPKGEILYVVEQGKQCVKKFERPGEVAEAED